MACLCGLYFPQEVDLVVPKEGDRVFYFPQGSPRKSRLLKHFVKLDLSLPILLLALILQRAMSGQGNILSNVEVCIISGTLRILTKMPSRFSEELSSTHDQNVFSFYPDGHSCNGFVEALSSYREIVPHLRLAGPTSFAPIIEMAMSIVEQRGEQYHILLIVADGQVTKSKDTGPKKLSHQEKRTLDAIVQASQYPLSIVLVGVGDGPWDTMKEFGGKIPARKFDNFQFVNFTEIMSKHVSQSKKESEFAVKALTKIPLQYKATIELGLLGRAAGKSAGAGRIPLPPPDVVRGMHEYNTNIQGFLSSQKKSAPPLPACDIPSPVYSTNAASSNNHGCPVCLTRAKDTAFGCGHQTCRKCGQILQNCPICRKFILTRIRLY